MIPIDIKISYSPTEIKELVRKGYTPIECAIGSTSIVDDLVMDHHNEYSNKEGVAIRALRDHYGARKDNPKFIVLGNCDADASFAIAALSGIVPKNKESETLAQLIDDVDNHRPADLLKRENGSILIVWNKIIVKKEEGWYGGVYLWPVLLHNPSIIEIAKRSEKQRLKYAKECDQKPFGDDVMLVKSPVWGFDFWYKKANIVVAFVEKSQKITVGASSDQIAIQLFGDQGLMSLCEDLDKSLETKGFGGRTSIIGSPKGTPMTMEQAEKVSKIISERIKK